jgi:NADPH:quinone reductase-like Zn-dependent oxidoreductase
LRKRASVRPAVLRRSPRQSSLRDDCLSKRGRFPLNRAIELHRLQPVIDRTFPFAEAKAAYRHFEGRGHFGKVVITHD